MKITKEQLKQIIKEELASIKEAAGFPSSGGTPDFELPQAIRTKARRDIEYYTEMGSKLPDDMGELKAKLEEIIKILGSLSKRPPGWIE